MKLLKEGILEPPICIKTPEWITFTKCCEEWKDALECLEEDFPFMHTKVKNEHTTSKETLVGTPSPIIEKIVVVTKPGRCL